MLGLSSRGGELHEALFGDLAFTRILRQNQHDLEDLGGMPWSFALAFRPVAKASYNWIGTFFGTFEDLEGDKAPLPAHSSCVSRGFSAFEVFPELLQRVASVEKEERMIETKDLPGINDVDGFVSLIYNLPSLTKTLSGNQAGCDMM